jgi:hypothetical protein
LHPGFTGKSRVVRRAAEVREIIGRSGDWFRGIAVRMEQFR